MLVSEHPAVDALEAEGKKLPLGRSAWKASGSRNLDIAVGQPGLGEGEREDEVSNVLVSARISLPQDLVEHLVAKVGTRRLRSLSSVQEVKRHLDLFRSLGDLAGDPIGEAIGGSLDRVDRVGGADRRRGCAQLIARRGDPRSGQELE